MENIGTVRSIINDELILIESNVSLVEGERLVVSAVIESQEIASQTGLALLTIPKGEIIVRNYQGKNIYLAATGIFEEKKKVTFESPLGVSLAASIAGFGGKRVETIESVPKSTPLRVDSEKNLGIKYKKEVTIGDTVSRWGG